MDFTADTKRAKDFRYYTTEIVKMTHQIEEKPVRRDGFIERFEIDLRTGFLAPAFKGKMGLTLEGLSGRLEMWLSEYNRQPFPTIPAYGKQPAKLIKTPLNK